MVKNERKKGKGKKTISGTRVKKASSCSFPLVSFPCTVVVPIMDTTNKPSTSCTYVLHSTILYGDGWNDPFPPRKLQHGVLQACMHAWGGWQQQVLGRDKIPF